jgi:4-amino-4-deoxy-L-arabinose transferase-like glycosyltransferase
MEMMASGNYFNPTFLGQAYTMKPPMFNWVIILFSKIFSDPVLALRLPTVLSTISMGFLLYLFGRKYFSREFGWLTTISFISSFGILFYFSLLGEIDLFYSLLTLILFLSLIHFYEQKKFLFLFITVYLFGALGFLTKGFPSILFLGLSLPIPFLYDRKFKKLLSWQHLAGLFIFLIIIGGYIILYKQQMDPEKMISGVWSQASQRTLIYQKLSSFITHLVTFPLETLWNILPGSLLLIFLIKKGSFHAIRSNKILSMIMILLLVNIVIYWISPGTRQRYIYMFYPLILMPGVYLFLLHQKNGWMKSSIHLISLIFTGLLMTGSIIINLIDQLAFIGYLLPLSIMSFISFLLIFLSILKNKNYSFHFLILTLALARIVFDLTALPARNHAGFAFEEKKLAETIYQIAGEEDIHIYKNGLISMTTIYYLNQKRTKLVNITEEVDPGEYIIARTDLIQDLPPYDFIMEIEFDWYCYHLVKIIEMKTLK